MKGKKEGWGLKEGRNEKKREAREEEAMKKR